MDVFCIKTKAGFCWKQNLTLTKIILISRDYIFFKGEERRFIGGVYFSPGGLTVVNSLKPAKDFFYFSV